MLGIFIAIICTAVTGTIAVFALQEDQKQKLKNFLIKIKNFVIVITVATIIGYLAYKKDQRQELINFLTEIKNFVTGLLPDPEFICIYQTQIIVSLSVILFFLIVYILKKHSQDKKDKNDKPSPVDTPQNDNKPISPAQEPEPDDKIENDEEPAIINTPEVLNPDVLPGINPLPEIHVMPYRSINTGFVGRVADLWGLHDMLQKSRTPVITADCSSTELSPQDDKDKVALVCGMGGIGKSQLAVEYVHRFGHLYKGGVFWIDAETTRADMVVRLSVTLKIDIDERLTDDERIETIWSYLTGFKAPVLVVLDNFKETGELGPWLPVDSTIHTLVTTRRKDLIDYMTLSLDTLSNEEGAILINSRGRDVDSKEAGALSELLGGLPLALELACYYLNRKSTLTIEDLIIEIKEHGEFKALEKFTGKYSDQLPTKHEKSVSAMFEMAWDSASGTAKDILRAMSVLAPYPVPRRLLIKILYKEATPENENTLDEGLSELTETLALTTLDDDSDPICHRLVIGFVLTILEDEEFCKTLAHAVLEEMNRVEDEYDTASYVELEKVVPHGVHLLATDYLDIEPKVDMGIQITFHYRKHGQLRLAEKYGRETLKTAQDNLYPGHETIAKISSYLASVLQDLGDLDEAKELFEKALESDIKTFGQDHSTVAIRRSNLALVLKDLGDLEKAKKLYEKALESGIKNLGQDHPHVAIYRSSLALVLKNLGDLEGARDHLNKALESDINNFGLDHSNVAIRRSNLALVLKDLGDLEGAREHFETALESDIKNFGLDHPYVAIYRSNLAIVLQNLGDLEGAREHLDKALESGIENFGQDHSSVAISRSNLASVLKNLGDLEGAREHLNKALESDINNFGLDHSYVAIDRSNLALVLKDLGDIEEARELAETAYNAMLNRYGPDFPITKSCKAALDKLPKP